MNGGVSGNDVVSEEKQTSKLPPHTVTFSSFPPGVLPVLIASMNPWKSLSMNHLAIAENILNVSSYKEMCEKLKGILEIRTEIRDPEDRGPWQCIIGQSFASAISCDRQYCLMVNFPSLDLHV
jgi:hypothetical protein